MLLEHLWDTRERGVVAVSEQRLKTVKQMVAEARERIHTLSVEQVASEIEGGEALC